MGNSKDKERCLGEIRGGPAKRAKNAKRQQCYHSQQRELFKASQHWMHFFMHTQNGL